MAELAERGLKVDYGTMWSFIRREGLSFQKSVAASERDRPAVAPKIIPLKRAGRACCALTDLLADNAARPVTAPARPRPSPAA